MVSDMKEHVERVMPEEKKEIKKSEKTEKVEKKVRFDEAVVKKENDEEQRRFVCLLCQKVLSMHFVECSNCLIKNCHSCIAEWLGQND